MIKQSGKICVHMFSGGRDSTLAAIRLARNWEKLVLVTATAKDMTGLVQVKQRLNELKPYLPDNTEWYNIALPSILGKNRNSTSISCLSCHHSYLVVGSMIAEQFNSKHLALGYTGYQSNWTEQTPYAIQSLKVIMGSIGLEIVLPVSDIMTKEEAIAELRSYKLSETSLEQKCLRQFIDPNLQNDLLHQEVNRMGKELVQVLADCHSIKLNIVDHIILKDL